MSVAARWRVRLLRGLGGLGFSRDVFLYPAAALIGIAAGSVAAGFDWLVFSSGEFFFGLHEHEVLPNWDYLMLLMLPALGGLCVGVLGSLTRQTPGAGIPLVMEAISRRAGRLPIRSGVFKAVSSTLTIGSGGSAGVEGPIIHIGSVVGSGMSRLIVASRDHTHTLIGCGAAGAMAGIFNAPIAGVMFVLEVILRDFSVKTFMPIVIASVLGTSVAQAIGDGNQAVFNLPDTMIEGYQFTLSELPAYAVLGLGCGILGVGFARWQQINTAAWSRARLPGWLKPALGGLLLGVTGVLFVMAFDTPVAGFEPPLFFANGYAVIEAALNPASYTPNSTGTLVMQATPWLLLAALVGKIMGTGLTLGSGGAGGIFAPSLFIGAMFGGLFGMAVDHFELLPNATPATYALCAMAGVLAATVHCPMTAFLLVFELTQDYKVILPTMLVSILALIASQFFQRDSIYVMALRERGIVLGTSADMTLLRKLAVSDVSLVPAVMVQADEPAARLVELAEDYAASDFVVCDEDDCYQGMVVGQDLRTTLVHGEAIPLMIVGELARTDLPTLTREDTLDRVLDKFSKHDVASLAVLDDRHRVQGLITRSRLMRRYQRALSR